MPIIFNLIDNYNVYIKSTYHKKDKYLLDNYDGEKCNIRSTKKIKRLNEKILLSPQVGKELTAGGKLHSLIPT